MQVADAPALQMDPLSLSRHYRCYPGQGDYPIVDYLDAIADTGYRGPVSLEIFNDQFRGASAATIALDGMRSLRALGEQVNAARAARAAPPLADLPALPPAPEVEGVEFIEFAASDADSAALISLIEGLGFARAGRHRSKDVELFRQGEINIVVNQDREGFAHAFHSLHGASVCALALRVDSVPEGAGARARDGRAELCRPHRSGRDADPRGGGRRGQPDLFHRRRRRTGSGPATSGSTRCADVGGALTRIDHLSNVVRRSEFLTWSLFYKTVLGLKPEAAVEIADPHGAFFSRSLRSANGALRIPLNISDGGETGVTRFIDAFGGAGYQQIALATDDIFAAVERARAGRRRLPADSRQLLRRPRGALRNRAR